MSEATKASRDGWRPGWFDSTYDSDVSYGPVIRPRLIPAIQVAADMLSIMAAGLIASVALVLLSSGQFIPYDDLAGLTVAAALLFPMLAHGRGLYAVDGWRYARKQAVVAFMIWLSIFAILAVMLFMLKAGALVSRSAALTLLFTGGMAVVAMRFALSHVLGSALLKGVIAPRAIGVLALGSSLDFDALAKQARTQGRQLVRAWQVGSIESAGEASDLGRQLVREIGRQRLDRLLIMVSSTQLDYVHHITDQLRSAPFAVSVVLDRPLQWLSSGPVMRLGERVAVEVSREPLRLFERIMKRTLDIAVAFSILLAIAPFLLLVAIAIRLDTPGSVIFRQRRDGFCGTPFYIYKFRSMIVMEDGGNVAQASRNDTRITRVGRFIRRTSIDELPQLWNVLRGDMSLVGPRPHAVSHGESYSNRIPDYSQRHHVKPGLTGWAQVNGCRGETREIEAMERRVEHDLWYISHWSMWLDIKIIVRTAWIVLMDRNAF